MFGLKKKRESASEASPAAVEELLTRGVADVVETEHLRKRLLSGESLRVKLGIDPTSPHIHLGRAVQLLKLRDFQQLGHTVVLIIGDSTGVIGDTSDKDAERPLLTETQVEKHCATYLDQAARILDIDAVEVRYNSSWLNKLSYREIGEQADQFSLADFIERDNIKRRLNDGKRVSLREVLYPLMQGYDSVAVEADVEIGGTDQWFNLLAGRRLQSWAGQTPQDILTTELIEGTDGRKMSSSWGNTINITEEPDEMFGKVMRTNDELVTTYFTALTRVPLDEVERITNKLAEGTNPRDAKLRLAYEIVALFHDEQTAEAAKKRFIDTFSEKKAPTDLEPVQVPAGSMLGEVLLQYSDDQNKGIPHISSRSELRRLIEQGAVKNIDTGERITGLDVPLVESITLKIGKRSFVRIEVT